MQKTFIHYTFAILTTAIFLIFFINFFFTLRSLENQHFNSFYAKSEQVIHTLENNQAELDIINENLNEDYLTRAKAAEYVLDRQEVLSLDVSDMQYLANLLDVDEVHVIDENGIIVSGSVSQYIGIDMSKHKQTRAFLSLLENDDKNAFLIQEPQPNAAENKIMQYVGVTMQSRKGVVQVGFQPVRRMKAEERNTYKYIFSKFPTDVGEELFAVDNSTGAILGHSSGLNQKFNAECYQLAHLTDCTEGNYKKGRDGEIMYVTAKPYQDKLICVALPRDILFQKLWEQTLNTFLYLLFIEAIVLLLLNYLVKRKVIDGIHHIIENLTSITNGNLDTTVTVAGNQEFESLSHGINTMVKSLVASSDRTSAIIEISGIPLAAFEYTRGFSHVFATSGLKELLNIPEQMAKRFYSNSILFDRYIRDIMSEPVGGENDIYQIHSSRYVRIHMSESSEKQLGVVTDVSKNIQEKRQMQYENTHDALTGLYKYPHFKYLAGSILQDMPQKNLCAVVMLDLDYFKSINDTFGHDAGDRYLQTFSSALQSMPSEHVLTARRSGDEFCMMIFNCKEKSDIIKFLDTFYDTLKTEEYRVVFSSEQVKTISASAGFAWTDNPETNLTELLTQADEALYEMKRHTKGTYQEYAE